MPLVAVPSAYFAKCAASVVSARFERFGPLRTARPLREMRRVAGLPAYFAKCAASVVSARFERFGPLRTPRPFREMRRVAGLPAYFAKCAASVVSARFERFGPLRTPRPFREMRRVAGLPAYFAKCAASPHGARMGTGWGGGHPSSKGFQFLIKGECVPPHPRALSFLRSSSGGEGEGRVDALFNGSAG
jgi:hypothetical protein